jgi:hypothetical protein
LERQEFLYYRPARPARTARPARPARLCKGTGIPDFRLNFLLLLNFYAFLLKTFGGIEFYINFADYKKR